MLETIILIVIWLLPIASMAWLVIRHDKRMKHEYDIKLRANGEDIAILKAVVKDMNKKLETT
jgi:hypothetical protein